MYTVYLSPDPSLDNALHIYMSSQACQFLTPSSFEAIKALRTSPLWRMLIKREDLLFTKAADLDLFFDEDGDDPFYPKAKLENVTDDFLMEIKLLASRGDRVEHR